MTAVASRRRSSPAARRKKLVERLWAAAEIQVADVEQRMLALAGDGANFEAGSRALGTIAKLLKELIGIDGLIDAARGPGKPVGERSGDDISERSLDDFRNELARRLDQMRRERDAGRTPDGSEPL